MEEGEEGAGVGVAGCGGSKGHGGDAGCGVEAGDEEGGVVRGGIRTPCRGGEKVAGAEGGVGEGEGYTADPCAPEGVRAASFRSSLRVRMSL